MQKRIFSGIQPSGVLHLGNYLGAIKNWMELQDKYESIFCVVDLHAITVPQKPEELRQKTIEVAKIYLAAGINPEKSTIFVQSHIPEHTELAWILNTITKIPELERMTQFKDKSQEFRQHLNAGLFNYPILMAADILLYDTNLVPVGEDQLQHVEIARTLAKRFNTTFGKTFVIPEPFVVKEGMRIMGLDNPAQKMSKSASSKYNYIALTDSPEKIREKIKRAVTDSGKTIKYSDDQPAIKNLINIYALLDNAKPKDIEDAYHKKGYAEFKKDLAEVIVDFLKDFQLKYNDIDDKEVMSILQQGAEKLRPLAEKKMEEVKEKVGLI
ncbi:MAG: tryptophan--tRNA ligase [Candidatus Moranbacteria bacterium CG_4_10_14_3_um_filter_44_15]|nr:MAG: tryptophan--tRNA ligase [Candidatus Moranbacteria bacterium CG06_land_8_20_14_3_00_43_56]PIV83815.1 MAG: tryptophan--tRNA ligase [Candidatus Moranbacteria bacterium CG17_big_fil_post_rev_8_21_14_2_50_44_12]PIW93124.1 MAG: tryptophan--tRNA ligase [Candidatus Moranbacteria bacterium CG_4_8_14_3_um_filter_43_15]PIX90752.1 MAG: tryptophan--tRNA ligase [Candidatus Moranbacteria bacterium CG_4_10_14_3_um_filter_44_15]PJA86309.1 MAG: tryptophan--tRNA ligase [Candidatus Moranbacteria bacterium 